MLGILAIRTRFLLFYSLSFALLIVISGVAIFAVISLGQLTASLDNKWMKGTRVLGEMADLLTEIRLGETRLSLASSQEQAQQALFYTDARMRELLEQRAAYGALQRSAQELSLLGDFDKGWSAWEKQHRRWASLSNDLRLLESEAFQAQADALYRNADDAIDALIQANADGATDAGQRARRIVVDSELIVACAGVIALLVLGWVALMVHRQLLRPLGSITEALSQLSRGNRSLVMPESGRRDEIGKLARAFEIFRANTFALEEAHRAAEEAQAQALALARHDPLTGLANRRVLAEDMEKALSRVERFGRNFAVLLIDLDRFKPVNDVYGHMAGDAVLCEIASRLKETVRKNDTLSRIGGDEFAVICELEAESADKSEEIVLFAERVLTAVRAPVQLKEIRVEVDASIGIAFGPADGTDAESILRAADIAMYRAKGADRGAFRFYEQSMGDALRARAELEADLRRAVALGKIEPYYQPLVELGSGKHVGFEVLARWNHPDKGNIPPLEFIPIIEHLGLIGDFTWGILRHACLDAKGWPADLGLSVNISPSHLRDPTFPVRLLQVLQETGFPPRRLEIEITETALLTDVESVKAVLVSLQALGIKIAIDDFGTGYSSLNHLRELKLDKIKIDRSFIQSMNEEPESATIVNAILGLAKSLHLPTTAEGIEDAEALDRMSKAGCEIGQGYYFAKAMPAAEAADWIAAHRGAGPGARRIA